MQQAGDTEQGRLLAGRYRLTSVLGRGGMGTVWRARDEMLDREVAVKEVLVRGELTGDERTKMRERTLREARATARLNHPGIVTVHDVVDEDDRPWIVMELVPSRSLQEVLDTEGPLPPDRVAGIGRQMVAALRAAHAAGILHRDIKPANVLITTPGPDAPARVVLTDFGIAQAPGDAALTQTGMLIGSPAYMPPERVRGERAVAASDLWAVGATLYAAVEGRPPHQRADAMAVLAAVMTEDPPQPHNAGPLTAVLGGLLQRDPARRLTAAQAEEMLEQLATGSAPRPAPEPQTATFQQPAPYGHGAGDPGTPYAQPAPYGQQTLIPGMPYDPTSSIPPGYAQAQAPAVRRGPNAGLLVLVGALVTAVIALAAVLLLRTDGGTPETPPSTGPAQAGVNPNGQNKNNKNDDDATLPSTGQTTAPATEPPVPAGLTLAQGPGYTIAVPEGWVRSEEGNSVFWREPSSAAYVQVDRTPWSGDPVAHWEQWEREVIANGALENYQRVGLRRPQGLTYSAADIEFTWIGKSGVPMRGIDRGTVVTGRPFAVFVAIPADQWADSVRRVNNILGSFRP